MSKRKYIVKEKITSFDDLRKQHYVYVGGKLYHEGWYCSWPIRRMAQSMARGEVYRVEFTDKAKILHPEQRGWIYSVCGQCGWVLGVRRRGVSSTPKERCFHCCRLLIDEQEVTHA